MFYKEYKPTCVELLFGRTPQRFLAECAIPKHRNARLRNQPASLRQSALRPKTRYAECRYCPTVGNVLRIDEFSTMEGPHKVQQGRNARSRNQWNKSNELKSNKEKFQEWFLNKRVQEMKEAGREEDDEITTCCCCTYCSGDARGTSVQDVIRCGCCVCGEASHEIPEERHYPEDLVGSQHRIIERKDQGNHRRPCGRACDDRHRRLLKMKSGRVPKSHVSRKAEYHSNLGERRLASPHVPPNAKDYKTYGTKLRRPRADRNGSEHLENDSEESPSSIERPVSPRSPRHLKQRFEDRELSATSYKHKDFERNCPCVDQRENANDAAGISDENLQSSRSDDSDEADKDRFLNKLKDESLKRLMEASKYVDTKSENSNLGRFIDCNCEYSSKGIAPDHNCKYDVNAVQILREKLDEAVAEIRRCRNEVEMSRNQSTKCNFDPEYSVKILSDCQQRCAHLERLVQKLDRNLVTFEDKCKELKRSDRSPHKIRDEDVMVPRTHFLTERIGAEEERRRRKINGTNPEKKDALLTRTKPMGMPQATRPKSGETPPTKQPAKKQISRKRSKENELRTTKKAPRRTSEHSVERHRRSPERAVYHVKEHDDCRKGGGACYHIKCFPSNHVFENPTFMNCPQYEQVVEDMKRKRRFRTA